MIITDVRSAEMIKYASNAFLATKISFINEIANICEAGGRRRQPGREGHGPRRAHRAAFLQAGLGYGGSCFPKDTDALVHTAAALGYDFALLRAGGRGQPERASHVVEHDRARRWAPLDGRDDRRCSAWPSSPTPTTCARRKSVEVVAGLLDGGRHVRAYDPVAMANARALLPRAVDVLRVRLRGGRGRGRGGPRHRVERVQVPEPRAAARASMRRPARSSTGATSTSPSGCAASASSTTRSAASPSCRRAWELPAAGHRKPERDASPRDRAAGSSAPTSASSCSARAARCVCMDNLLTGSPRQHRPPARRAALPASSSTTSPTTSTSTARSTTCCTSPARPRPIDYLELPIQTLKVGSLGTHNALGLAKAKRARLPARLHLRGLRRSARAPAARGLLGQRQPGRPARRLRRGQALRRGDDHGLPPLPRRRHAHRPDLQHLRPAHAAERRPGDPRPSSTRRCAASRSPSSATARRRARSAT